MYVGTEGRLKCDDCGSERLLTLSCKQRGICPSCDAKRAAAFALFSKTSYWKTLAIVCGHLPFPRCYDPTSCVNGSFWGIWLALLMRLSRS